MSMFANSGAPAGTAALNHRPGRLLTQSGDPRMGVRALSAADPVIHFREAAASSTRWINWVVEIPPVRRT